MGHSATFWDILRAAGEEIPANPFHPAGAFEGPCFFGISWTGRAFCDIMLNGVKAIQISRNGEAKR